MPIIRMTFLCFCKLVLCSLIMAPQLSQAQPINDACNNAIAVTQSGQFTINTQAANLDIQANQCDEFRSTTKGIWYYMVGKGNEVIISTCFSTTEIDTWIGVYEGLCDNLTCVEYDNNDDNNDPMGGCATPQTSVLRFMAKENVTYYILIGGIMDTDVGTIELGFFCPLDTDCIAADECPTSPKILASVCGCNKIDYSVDGNAPTIFKNAPLTINNPVNDTTCLFGDAQFSINATAGAEEATLAYRWQVVTNEIDFSGNGATVFSDISDNDNYSNSTTNTLNITRTPQNFDELQYRVIVTQTLGNTNCIDTSEMATLSVFAPPIVSVSPQTDTICVTNDTQFSMEAMAGEATASLTYRWQVSTNGGSTFDNLMDHVLYQGSQTKKLSLSKVSHDLDEYQYRTIVTQTIGNFNCYDTTDVAILYVFQPPSVSLQPKTDTVCVTNNVQFVMDISTEETVGQLSYHWQVSLGEGLQFTDLMDNTLYQGTQTKSLNITNTPHSLDEYQYRAIATQTIGTNQCFDTTEVVTLYVFQPPIVSLNPENSTICVQQSTSFSGDANSSEAGSLSYEWQVSSDGGQQFMPLSDNALYRQTNTTELKVDNALFALNQHLYRLIVKEKIGTIVCQDTSTLAKITVRDNPRINRAGQKFHDICGDMIDLSGTTTPDSEGSWTFVNAAPENSAELSDTNNIETLVTGVFGGQYTLRWTISNSVCKGRMDEIQIDFNPDKDLPGGLPDGAQDCVDLCIGGDDRINSDSLGMPDDCDCLPSDTTNEFAQVLNEEFQLFVEQQIALGLDTLLRKGDFELTSNAVIDPSKEENDFPTIIFQAYQSITLTEGFHVKSGAHFMAKLGYCRNPLTGETNTVTGFNNRPKIILPTSRPILEKVPIPTKTIQFEVFPTVVKQQAGIALSLPATNQVAIGLYDQNGRFIKTYLENSQFEAGKYYFQLDASALSAGLYILRLVGIKEVISKKIIVH